MTELDPVSFDRGLASAAQSGAAFVRSLRTATPDSAEELAAALEGVANREALHWARELPAEDPTRAPSLRWLHCLIDLRVNAASVSGVALEYRHAKHQLEAPTRGQLSLHRMIDRALAEPAKRAAWLESILDNGQRLQDVSLLLWERHMEVSRRMGFESPLELAPIPDLDLPSHLASTKEMLEHSGSQDLESFIELAMAHGAAEGWPAHLNPRSLTSFFGEAQWFDGLTLRFGPLPAAISPASFLRGLGQLGGLFFQANASDSLPFSLSRDPYGLGNQVSGALLVWLGISESFLRKNLKLGTDRAREQRRHLARSLLLESRAAVLRCRLARVALQGQSAFFDQFEELCHDTLGFPLPRGFGLVLLRPRVDADQRYLGLLLGASEYRRLRDLHDEDFYRNPRAVEQLRGEARRPAPYAVRAEQVEAGLRDLRQLLLDTLG